MKRSLFLCVLGFVSQHYFSQTGFCMNLLTDPPFGSYCSSAMAKGDFNNDGQMDFCIQSAEALPNVFLASKFGVGVLLSNGTGSFTSFPSYTLTTTGRVFLTTAGDFTNDGNLDVIAVCNNDSAFFLLTGDGAGNFISKTTYTTPSIPNSMVTADFNGDGKPDLAYSCVGTQSLSIVYGGIAGFGAPVNYSIASVPQTLIQADFDNDTKPDLMALTGITSYFFKGSANGVFTPTTALNISAINAAAEDINADNNLDLVCTDINNNKVRVLTGNGNFSFIFLPSYPVQNIGGGLNVGPVSCADFNGDGNKDLAVVSSSYTTNFILIFPGLGNGLFSAPVSDSLGFYSGFNRLYNFSVTDFNNDNKPDILALVSDDGVMPFMAFKLFENCSMEDVGIKEATQNGSAINLFPNPVANFLQIQMSSFIPANVSAKIYNALGQIVLENKPDFENGKATVNTTDLPNGVYFLQLVNNMSATVSKQFVVSR